LSAVLGSAEFQMSLLLFVALAGNLIAYGINQSAVVGIILVGIVVGPSLLGLVTYTDFVSNFGHLGAVVLLFTIGLEFELKEITKLKYVVIARFWRESPSPVLTSIKGRFSGKGLTI